MQIWHQDKRVIVTDLFINNPAAMFTVDVPHLKITADEYGYYELVHQLQNPAIY